MTFAKGLVRILALVAVTRNTDFMRSAKYNLGSARGLFFPNDQLRELPDPIPCRNDVIPEPDSIPPESVLNNPISKRLEINLAAFRPPEPTLSSAENDHPVSVFSRLYVRDADRAVDLECTMGSYTSKGNPWIP